MKKWNELTKSGKYKRLNEIQPLIGFNTDNQCLFDEFDYYFSRYEQEKDKNELDLDKARELTLAIDNSWIQQMLQ